jgi:hypothetical protein
MKRPHSGWGALFWLGVLLAAAGGVPLLLYGVTLVTPDVEVRPRLEPLLIPIAGVLGVGVVLMVFGHRIGRRRQR